MNTSRHVEVERKFDVDESTVLPSFDGLASVHRVERAPAQAMDAVYFDTAAHDLAAHRITLRRRTGGTDAGWHLKLPAGPDTRTEVHAPLGSGEAIPAELLDVVAAIVRGRTLAPVARIATVRGLLLLYGDDDVLLAQFCDDRVAACADGGAEQRWREWELELATGGTKLLDRLSNRLSDAGAVPAGHASKLARVLDTPPAPRQDRADPLHRAVAEQVQQLLVWDRAVRADADDAVHQMRVTTRRIRSLLQASGVVGTMVDELRQLAGVLGIARDGEVLAERYRTALDALPPELVRGPVADRLVGGAVRQYRSGLRRSLVAMRSPRYFQLLDALDQLVAAPPTPTAAPVNVGAAYRRVRRAARAAARAAGEPGRDEALHRIRKGAKRLRYTAAAAHPNKAGKKAKTARAAKRITQRAKAIQTLLGDHQDSVVSRAHLLQQAAAAHSAGEDTFSYGLLYQQESDLARDRRARLDPALRKLATAVRRGGRAGL